MQNYRKKLSVLFVTILTITLSYSQNPLWIIGNQFQDWPNGFNDDLPSFDPNGPSVDGYYGFPAEFASTAYHNPVSGELMFFVVDGVVYDQDGYKINDLVGSFPGSYGSRKMAGDCRIFIVPVPNECSKYYIIGAAPKTVFVDDPNYSGVPDALPFFAILDLSLDRSTFNIGRKGELVTFSNNQKIEPLWNQVPNSQKAEIITAPFEPLNVGNTSITITPKNSNGEHLIFWFSDRGFMYTFKINGSGLSYVNNSVFYPQAGVTPAQWLSMFPNFSSFINQRVELEVFQLGDGNYRLIGAHSYDWWDKIFKMDFTANGDPIFQTFQQVALQPHAPGEERPYIKGLEVSPNQQYLYFTLHATNSLYPKALMCLDLNTFTAVNLPNITTSVANQFLNSSIETNILNQMLLVNGNGLSIILNADTPGTASILQVISQNIMLSTYGRGAGDSKNDFYLLPAQMDFDPNCQINCYSYNCSQNNQEISCCNLYSSANVFVPTQNYPDYVVETSATWSPGLGNNPFGSINGVVEFNGNLVIRPGATLTVNGMTLKFSSKSRVIVERDPNPQGTNGAVLRSEYTLFTTTSDCGACFLWPGIEVQGHNSLPQSSSKHARVNLQKGTIIEHAYFGLLAGRIVLPDQVGQGSLWASFAGGIINVEEVLFRNNRHDIYFTEYAQSSSSSFIYNCDFQTNADLRLSLSQLNELKHVVIDRISGVRVFNCTFNNLTLVYTDGIPRGEGIRSMNAEYEVNSCIFHQLDYGIYAMNANSVLPFSVINSNFTRNFNGIFALNVNSPRILSNNFDLYNSSPNSMIFQTSGISLTGCNRYRVEQNSFTDNSQTHPNAQTYGIVAFNSGTNANVIENNSFSNLHSGGVSAGVNAASYTNPNTNLRGLQWLCNDFSDNKVNDLWVRSGRIAPWQGACNGNPLLLNTAAGNKFNTSQNPVNHIFLGANVPQILYFRGTPTNENPTLTNVNPTNIILCNSNNTICFEGRPGGDGELSEQDLKNLRLQLIDEKYAAKLLLDYSDKDSTINLVLSEYLTPQQKRDILVSGTTIISDEVLIKYILSNPPHTMLYQVLVHNSPLSDKVIYYMMEESDMTNGMKQQVLYIQNGLPENEAILQHIQNIDLNIAHIENGLISMYLQDSTAAYTAQDVVNLVNANPHKEQLDLELLFQAHVTAKNATKADSLNTILKGINTDPEYAILNDLAVAAMTTDYFTVIHDDSLLIAQLEEMAYFGDYMYAYPARAILSGVLGYKFEYPIDEEFENRSAILPTYKYDGTPIEIITIFPNPTTDNFFIVFDENADVSQTREARVYDLAGNLQFTRSFNDNAYVLEINTENMTKGMYIVVISANGTDVGTYKVAVR